MENGAQRWGALAECKLQQVALLEAGFREVSIIWQNFDNCVLMAVR